MQFVFRQLNVVKSFAITIFLIITMTKVFVVDDDGDGNLMSELHASVGP